MKDKSEREKNSVRLRDLVSVRRGLSWDKDQETSEQEGVPVLRIPNIQERLDCSNLLYLKNIDKKKITRNLARKGNTVLIASNGNPNRIGNCAYIEADSDFCVASFLITVESNNSAKLRPKFLYRLISSPLIQTRITKDVQGSTGLNNIDLNALLDTRVHIPHSNDQEGIIDLLDKIDHLINVSSNRLCLIKETKNAAMQGLLYSPTQRKSEYSEIRFGNLFSERKERGKPGLPTLSVTMHDGMVDREEHGRRVTSELSPEEHLLAHKDDLVYNMMRMWQGVSGLAPLDGLVSPAYVVLRPLAGIDPLFASYLFKLPETIRLFHRYSQGLTNDRLRLYFEQFAEIKVLIPDKMEEQRRIAHFLSAFDSQIQQTESEIEALKTTKTAICQEIFV